MTTIRDVAKKADVSVATVSRVLNDSGYADAETRTRVLRAAEELNYRRNVHWSRLKKQSSQTVLFLLGNRLTLNSMQMRLLVSCERALKQRGFDLLFNRFEYSSRSRPNELILPRLLETNGALDGVILAGIHHENILACLKKRQIPYSLLGNNFEGEAKANSICYDDRAAVYEATQYLLRLGHRRIAFVGNISLPWFKRRYQGYLAALEEDRLDAIAITENWQISNVDYGQLSVEHLLRGSTVPTAIVAGNDEIAAGVWKELVKRKMSPPKGMSLIGLGDRSEFSILEPGLTSISVFEEQLGERLTAMLLRQIEEGKKNLPPENYPCKLIERASCAPLAEVKTLQQVKR